MTPFIQLFVDPTSWPNHLIWVTLLAFLVAGGPDVVSLDALVVRFFGRGAEMRMPHTA